MQRVLTIYLNDSPEDDEMIVNRVAELVSQGYQAGREPSWEIREVTETTTTKGKPV